MERVNLLAILKGFLSRINAIQIFGVGIGIGARSNLPNWTDKFSKLDLRHEANSMQINESFISDFIDQLLQVGTAMRPCIRSLN